MGDLIQFVPRSNPKRIPILQGPSSPELESLGFDIVNQIFPSEDTAPSEYCCAAEKDPA